MKKTFMLLLALCYTAIQLLANGVAIVNAETGLYLNLVRSEVKVQVNDQVAITTTTQTFKNQTGNATLFKYAFPVPGGGTTVELRWQVGAGTWETAAFEGSPQDPSLPGGGGGAAQNIDPNLLTYLGSSPLFFEVLDTLGNDSLVTIEMTYVELLPYKNGQVLYRYPANYSLIQSTAISLQTFQWNMVSGRKIVAAAMTSHPSATVDLTDYQAHIEYLTESQPASLDFAVSYELDAQDLGLFSFSNYLTDTLPCDNYGQGFCAFVVEPTPTINTDVIPKVFTLIIDRSGSMGGSKMEQAKEAASFIVNNLNPGDLFNIVSFSSDVTALTPDHVPFNTTNKANALAHIAGMAATGTTNISGAFSTALPHFSNDNDNTYNIIIFFTDGEATEGITSTPELVNHINSIVTNQELEVTIFTFGIGSSVNQSLLTQIAQNHGGISTFLGNNELESAITEFYQTIRYPVLLNTNMSFDPDLVKETYPISLPNLYKGSQMLVVGRYQIPDTTVNVHLTGQAVGNPVTYDYNMHLTGADSILWRFLPKLWAKQKAAHLEQLYYAATDPVTKAALQEEIQGLGTCYGIITSQTSLSDPGSGGGGVIGVEELFTAPGQEEGPVVIQQVWPNPANDHINVLLDIRAAHRESVLLILYDALGREVASMQYDLQGQNPYHIVWRWGKSLSKGIYKLQVQSEVGTDTQIIEIR